MNAPEVVTPWLVLITTAIGATAAIGGALVWTRRKATQTFVSAVLDAVTPLQQSIDRLSNSIVETDRNIETKLTARSTEVDGKFGAIERRLGAIEQRISKTNETVATKIPDPPPAGAGGGGE